MDGLKYWILFALVAVIGYLIAAELAGGTSAKWLPDFADISLNQEQIPAVEPQPKHDAPAPAPQRPVTAQQTLHSQNKQPADIRAPMPAALGHTARDREVCTRPRALPEEDLSTTVYYQWEDENGQTHLSDTPPTNRIAAVINNYGEKTDFTYHVEADGADIPPDFEGKLIASSKRIFDTWHFFLGGEKLRRAEISLRFIGGPGRYKAVREKAWPGGPPSYGFYSPNTNWAYVKYEEGNPDQALRTARHEISHLITTTHLGPTPVWLTEGLAEYFETMSVEWQKGTIPPNQAHLDTLRRERLPDLREYLALDRKAWHGPQRSLNYAIAWSLIHFLMEGAPGMYALKDVVEASEENFCKDFDLVTALGRAYPGGLSKLELDWRQWITHDVTWIHQT